MLPITSDFKLRDLSEKDLELVWNWRNSERIRKYMYHDNIITLDEHLQWFSRLENDHTKRQKVFELNNRPIGIVNFSEIDQYHKRCKWGFYLGEENLPKGTGTLMGYAGLSYIFEMENIRKVIGEVFEFNSASIQFHKKLGFYQEGCLRKHVAKNGEYIDILLFGYLQDEWQAYKPELTKLLFT
ncbi:MAG TPA: UDP-4-amino-4,6-dideoxy-N-acetyl-beta-L-altrosamine N-acetyltransferase [Candidatus Bathyarchaeia archaeon]|nr:UDP-4-amino-4,6-dideoxy-N-acetyl-beta-L-altrosamine N-acetyltransferase [Candidatus Bathyarchaeia archaeon]